MEQHFRLKHGDWELELTGERAFIEEQLARLLPQLLGTAAPAHAAEQRRVPASFSPQRNLDLAGLVRLKEARSPQDLLLVGAYYLEKYMRQDNFSPAELQQALAPLEAWDGQAIDEPLELGVAQGFLEPLRDGRYTLTYKGQNYVRDGLVT